MSDNNEDTATGFVHVGHPSRGTGRASDPRIDDIWRVVEKLDRHLQGARIQLAKLDAAGEVWSKVYTDLSARIQAQSSEIASVRQEIGTLRVDAVSEASKIRVEAAGEKGENKWPRMIIGALIIAVLGQLATTWYTSARISESLHSEVSLPHDRDRSSAPR